MKVRGFLWFLLALLFLAAVLIALRAAWLEPSSLRLSSACRPKYPC